MKGTKEVLDMFERRHKHCIVVLVLVSKLELSTPF